jgi:hypothetical protein
MVNYDLMYQAAVQNKGNSNQIVYWSRLPSWKSQTLTPNPGAVYLMPFYNTGVFLCVFQCQALGRRSVLPDDDQR